MEAPTVGEAVDVCLRALVEHLRKLVGHCPPLAQISDPGGTVVNLRSVYPALSAAFDDTVRRAAPEVLRPLVPHRRVHAKLAGTRSAGFFAKLLEPFTFRPGPWSLMWYLRSELLRRSKYFLARSREIELDLQAPLEVQAERYGRKMAYIVLAEMTRKYRWAATSVLWS